MQYGATIAGVNPAAVLAPCTTGNPAIIANTIDDISDNVPGKGRALARPFSFGRRSGIAPAMKARVTVSLKPGVLDPQGRAIQHALETLGFTDVADVRVGKVIELDVADGTPAARLEEMARRLLANTVIENFRVELT
jgi:phosphoribosylformylglycinamidine synthase